MDKLDTLTLFVRIVERGSFSAAAADLGFRPVATAAQRWRSSRRGCYIVPPGTYGRRQKARCIISAACPFWRPLRRPTAAPGSISGTIRVDVAGNLARTLLARAAALARYPDITLQIGESERDVDLVREGVDCVIRGGHLPTAR